jgi:hypothetical protein
VPLVGELLHETGLRDVRHVRRMPAGDRGREHRRDVVADRLVVDLDVRIDLVEGLDHLAEGFRLGAGPDAVERHAAGDSPVHVPLLGSCIAACGTDAGRDAHEGENGSGCRHAAPVPRRT